MQSNKKFRSASKTHDSCILIWWIQNIHFTGNNEIQTLPKLHPSTKTKFQVFTRELLSVRLIIWSAYIVFKIAWHVDNVVRSVGSCYSLLEENGNEVNNSVWLSLSWLRITVVCPLRVFTSDSLWLLREIKQLIS